MGGSVVVYVLVAACAGVGGSGGKDDGLAGNGADGASGPDSGGPDGSSTPDGGGILNPVPDAEAAEDGDRIVNIYRTTADGLKTPDGYWDKQLGAACNFLPTPDGKTRCIVDVQGLAAISSYFADASCETRLASVTKGSCAPEVAQSTDYVDPDACIKTVAWRRFNVGAKVTLTNLYQREADGDCVVYNYPLTNTDFYSVTEIPASTYAEGARTHAE